jgi:hypothetical protein
MDNSPTDGDDEVERGHTRARTSARMAEDESDGELEEGR